MPGGFCESTGTHCDAAGNAPAGLQLRARMLQPFSAMNATLATWAATTLRAEPIRDRQATPSFLVTMDAIGRPVAQPVGDGGGISNG